MKTKYFHHTDSSHTGPDTLREAEVFHIKTSLILNCMILEQNCSNNCTRRRLQLKQWHRESELSPIWTGHWYFFLFWNHKCSLFIPVHPLWYDFCNIFHLPMLECTLMTSADANFWASNTTANVPQISPVNVWKRRAQTGCVISQKILMLFLTSQLNYQPISGHI